MTQFLARTGIKTMALLTNCRNYQYSLYKLAQNLIKIRYKSLIVEVDAVDTFTTQLVQQKVNKWGKFHLKSRILSNASPIIQNQAIQLKTNHDLNKKLQTAIEENDLETIKSLLETCKEHRYLPTESVSHSILTFFAQTGNVEGIESVTLLTSEMNPTFLRVHSDFKHYLAEAVWVKGNVPKALNLFHEAYKSHTMLRRRIRWILRGLFTDAANNHSEAIMVSLLKFSEGFVTEFEDYSALGSLWRACFLSEWFSNQTIAMDLLEKHEFLLEAVIREIPLVVAESLKCHKTDPVYRLVELLLRYKCEMQYSVVLVALFEYKYRQRDFPGCVQILHWCTKNDVKLPSIQRKKMLNSLLKLDDDREAPTKKLKVPKLNYILQF